MLLRFEGSFEASDARRAREALGSGAWPVVLDFSQVRHFEDSAIALLAPSLAAAEPRVRMRGLGLHQQRILEYLGVGRFSRGDAGRRVAEGAELQA